MTAAGITTRAPIPDLSQRKNVTVILPDGSSSEKITYQEAFSLVEDLKTAEWRGSQRKAIQMIDKLVLARGRRDFEDAWQILPSGGIDVWQMNPEAIAA